MRKDRLAVIVGTIKANPACWVQGAFHTSCGTAHCIAGHAQINAGLEQDSFTARRDAMVWLELNGKESNYLFYSGRTIADFERVLSEGFDIPETRL